MNCIIVSYGFEKMVGGIMRKRLLLVSLLFMSASSGAYGFENPSFRWLHPTPTSGRIYAMSWITPDHGFILSSVGDILRTTNGGQSFTSCRYVGMSAGPMNDICFLDENRGWIAASGNYLGSTFDGGEYWTFSHLGCVNNSALRGVQFIDESYGTVVGSNNTIMRTNDGGITWTTQSPPVSGTWRDIHFNDPLTGWVAGSGGIVYTESAGAFWNLQTTGDFSAIDFTDATTCWAVGANGLVMHTTNGGQLWNDVSFTEEFDLTDVHFWSSDEGWISGDGCAVYHTVDGGSSWSLDTLEAVGSYENGYSVFAAGPGNAYWGGRDGMLFHTADGGSSWESLTSVTTFSSIKDVFFVDPLRGWAVGNQGTVIYTGDGGETWEDRSPDDGAGQTILCLHFDDEGLLGWAAGSEGYGVRTFNGGLDWVPMELGTASSVRDIAFNSLGFGVAVGDNGFVRQSSDSGETWEDVAGMPSDTYNTVIFADETTGFVAGNSGVQYEPGTILRFDMQGDSWCDLNNPHPVVIPNIHAACPDTVFAIYSEMSDSGILRFTDGGSTWDRISISSWGGGQGIFFENGQDGILLKGAHVAVVTSDGGSTWPHYFLLNGPSAVSANSRAFFLDGQHAWIPGFYSNVLLELTFGSTAIADRPPFGEVPGQPVLLVSPNPAHGSLQSVVFHTPSPGDYRIAVYDISGRLVIENHLGELAEGTHSFPLRADNVSGMLPSGVYFCSVQSETERVQGRFVVIR